VLFGCTHLLTSAFIALMMFKCVQKRVSERGPLEDLAKEGGLPLLTGAVCQLWLVGSCLPTGWDAWPWLLRPW
jgi:hypothetical protein